MNNNFPSGNKERVSLRNSEVWEMRYLRVVLGEYKFTVPGIGAGIFHRCCPQGTSKVGPPEPYCPETGSPKKKLLGTDSKCHYMLIVIFTL